MSIFDHCSIERFLLFTSIVFTVVGEPPGDQQDLECKDIGFATVDAREIFESGMDKIEKDINGQ